MSANISDFSESADDTRQPHPQQSRAGGPSSAAADAKSSPAPAATATAAADPTGSGPGLGLIGFARKGARRSRGTAGAAGNGLLMNEVDRIQSQLNDRDGCADP